MIAREIAERVASAYCDANVCTYGQEPLADVLTTEPTRVVLNKVLDDLRNKAHFLTYKGKTDLQRTIDQIMKDIATQDKKTTQKDENMNKTFHDIKQGDDVFLYTKGSAVTKHQVINVIKERTEDGRTVVDIVLQHLTITVNTDRSRGYCPLFMISTNEQDVLDEWATAKSNNLTLQ